MMNALQDFLPRVVGLFDKTIRAMLSQPVLALLLAALLFLISAGMFGWMIYLGRKGKL